MFQGLVLPLFPGEEDWPNLIRLFLYLVGLGWIFLGVAVISDIFMNGIEKITSSKRRVTNPLTGRVVTVYVWNATVANLTLMALGSSAPEILLSLIEITTADFMLGPLGAGTIVGSAAFNLLIISAVCVLAIPEGEVRYIKEVPVYIVTATFSVFAYLWLMFILMFSSKDVCEFWEAFVTLLCTPILVLLAYLADRGMFSKDNQAADLQDMQTIPDDVTDEELLAIEEEIRDEHGEDLTPDQIVRIMKATYFQKRSRAYYRHVAHQAALHGHTIDRQKSVLGKEEAIKEVQSEAEETRKNSKESATCEIGFEKDKYVYLENCGFAKIVLKRGGHAKCKASVRYVTVDGSAKETLDYDHREGKITFEAGEVRKEIEVAIKDDVECEDDEEFYIELSDPRCEDASNCKVTLSSLDKATVVIIDDDQPGQLRFGHEAFEIDEDEDDTQLEIGVERFNGATGAISCSYYTEGRGAVEGRDFIGGKGTLEFDDKEQEKFISVTIKPTGRATKAAFDVVLTDAVGCTFDKATDGGDETCICHIKIMPMPTDTRRNLLKEMRERAISANAIVGTRNWAQQFWNAIFQVGDDDDEDEDGEGEGEDSGPSYYDYAIHIASVPWKLLFAFVPPVDYCGGWACFFGALVMIAVVTALVSDMANLVGCCLDILPETAAITFVALGTSLPDTFASMAAAKMDPYADASIGNVTGSNSINVFMGIGLAWSLAAFKWQIGEPNEKWTKGFSQLTDDAKKNVVDFLDNDPTKAVFITPAGSIWFNLMVFSLNAFCAVWHLAARRAKYGGELGGPKKAQYFSAVFLIGQWFLYIIASIVFSRTVAEPLTYTQIAELDNA